MHTRKHTYTHTHTHTHTHSHTHTHIVENKGANVQLWYNNNCIRVSQGCIERKQLLFSSVSIHSNALCCLNNVWVTSKKMNTVWTKTAICAAHNILMVTDYSETCEIRTPLGRAKSVPNWEVSSFHRAISTENSTLGPDRCPYFTGCPHFAGLLFTGFTVLRNNTKSK
jgi:hypothetical protein